MSNHKESSPWASESDSRNLQKTLNRIIPRNGWIIKRCSIQFSVWNPLETSAFSSRKWMWLWSPSRWGCSGSHFSTNGWFEVSVIHLPLPTSPDFPQPSGLGHSYFFPKAFSAGPCSIWPHLHSFLKPKVLDACNIFTFTSNNILHYAQTIVHQTTRFLRQRWNPSPLVSRSLCGGLTNIGNKWLNNGDSLIMNFSVRAEISYSKWKELTFINPLLSDNMRVFFIIISYF